MAFNKTSQSPKLIENLGQFAPIAWGIATASSTTLTVTIPQFRSIYLVLGASQSTATSPFPATTVGNTFTMTVGSGEVINWIAIGQPKA